MSISGWFGCSADGVDVRAARAAWLICSVTAALVWCRVSVCLDVRSWRSWVSAYGTYIQTVIQRLHCTPIAACYAAYRQLSLCYTNYALLLPLLPRLHSMTAEE